MLDFVKKIYIRISLKIDKEIIKNLSEYFHLDVKETVWLLRSAERLNADIWRIYNQQAPVCRPP